VRAEDARSARPICGDDLAERFMDAEARAVFERFRSFRGPNASNAARHRAIDDILRERLRGQPDLAVVLLGAGLDTRAFRLAGGRWFELDQPALIERKEAKLPSGGAPNPLRRIAIDFAHESLADKLASLPHIAAPIVVMEGVSMYLQPDELNSTLRTLREVFSVHTLVCDLMTRTFARRYGSALPRRIEELGGRFAALVDDPASLVTSAGYGLVASRSIAGAAVDYGAPFPPRWLLNTLLRSLRDGYRIYIFDAIEASHP
jgi:methyltransferase (TIGR00027 family)